MKVSALRIPAAVVACLAVAMMIPAAADGHQVATAAQTSAEVTTGNRIPAQPPPRATDLGVLRRVVWDQLRRGRKGIHLRSAELDGSDRRPVYDSARGWTLELSMDRSGHRVAFSPCCRTELPTMVVAPVLGGQTLEPLKHHPRIYAVGGIGWSPNGRRIAFEGWHGTPPNHHKSIWTIRPDGTGLRKVLEHPRGRFDDSPSLAWTRDGILIIAGWNLVLVKAGETHIIRRHVYGLRISGDGSKIITKRYRRADDTFTIWISNPDGSDPDRLVAPFTTNDTWYDDVIPNYDASRLLSYRDTPSDTQGGSSSSDFVSWDTDADPDSAVVFDLINDGGYPATWN